MFWAIGLHLTKIYLFNWEEHSWSIFRNSGSLTRVFTFLFLFFRFWRFIRISLSFKDQINSGLSFVLIKVKYVNFNIKCVKFCFKGLEIAIDKMSHLLINYISWVNNIKNLIKGTNLFIMLCACNLISINFIIIRLKRLHWFWFAMHVV